MSRPVPLPSENAVKAMIEGMTGVDASVVSCEPEAAPSSKLPVAEYILDDGSVAATAFMSLPIAVAASAALGMVPQPDEKEVKAMDSVPEHLLANLRELMNVFAQLLNSNASPHVRLSEVYEFDSLPAGASSIATKADRRTDYSIEIAGRSGSLTFTAQP